MYKLIFSIIAISIFAGCGDDNGTNPVDENGIVSMYSLLNIDIDNMWVYDKFTRERQGRDWESLGQVDAEYLSTDEDSTTFIFYASATEENDFPVEFSVDSNALYLNEISIDDALAGNIVRSLDYDKIKVADLLNNTWTNDTLFFENFPLDEENSLTGYMSFAGERLSDTVITYKNRTDTLRRFNMKANIAANHDQQGYIFRAFPAYKITLLNNVGIYSFELYNHINTAIAVREIDYRLKDIIK